MTLSLDTLQLVYAVLGSAFVWYSLARGFAILFRNPDP